MYSKLPAQFGETPTKIVFEGQEHLGSKALWALRDEHQAAINAFQIKARQSRLTSEQPGSSMHQSLPNGQQFRYTYNHGQETIHIKLHEDEGGPAKPHMCEVLLAIDVLFDPMEFFAGDIYHKVPYTTTTPGAPLYPDNPDYYDFTGSTVLNYKQYFAIDPNLSGEDHFGEWAMAHPGPDGSTYYGYYHQGTFTQSGGGVHVSKYGPYLSDGPFGSLADCDKAAVDNHNNPNHGEIGFNRITWASYGGITSNNLGSYLAFNGYYDVTKWEVGGVYAGPRGPDVVTTNYHFFRERRTYLDILPVVGLRLVGAGGTDPDHDALSVGNHSQESDKLKAVLIKDASTTIVRSIAFADPAGGNHFYGASFLAKVTVQSGQGLSDQTIEVYLASSNVSQRNSSPGLVGSMFGVDDSTMNYDATTTLRYTIQVRELVDADMPLFVVDVGVDAEGKIEEFGPGSTETVTSTTMDQQARHLDWCFAAASKKWRDGGNEPADPNAKSDNVPTMGDLLASSDSDTSVNVVKTTSLARSVLTEPMWEGSVADMTKVATITWSPPVTCQVKGTAKIET